MTQTCQGGAAPKRLLAVPKTNPLEIPGAGGQDDAHVGQVGNQVVEQLSVGDLGDHVADERKLFVDAVHLGERIFEEKILRILTLAALSIQVSTVSACSPGGNLHHIIQLDCQLLTPGGPSQKKP